MKSTELEQSKVISIRLSKTDEDIKMFERNYFCIQNIFKNFRFNLVKLCTCVFVCTFLGTILIVFAYALPKTESLKQNIVLSSELLLEEGVYPSLFPWCMSQVDNYTDALILHEIAYDGNEPIVEKALMNYWIGNNKDLLIVTLNDFYAKGRKEGYLKVDYSRYWHGYVVFLKPLYYFFSLREIRIMLLIINILMSAYSFFVSLNRNRYLGISFLVTLLLLNIIVISHNMFFSVIFIVMNLGFIIVAKFLSKENGDIYTAFTVIGCIASYCDLLSYPLITLGIPLVFFIAANKEEVGKKLAETFLIAFSWGIGYFGMWISKWIVGSILVRKNLFSSAFAMIKLRTSRDVEGTHYTAYTVLNWLLRNLKNNPAWIIFIIICLVMIVISLTKKVIPNVIKNGFPYFAVILISLMWLLFKMNHSFQHSFFTYRELSTVCFAVLCLLGYSQMKT